MGQDEGPRPLRRSRTSDRFHAQRWHNTYSYTVDGEWYSNVVSDYSKVSPYHLRRDDPIFIEYNPRNPALSRAPIRNKGAIIKVLWFLLGATMVALEILYHFIHF